MKKPQMELRRSKITQSVIVLLVLGAVTAFWISGTWLHGYLPGTASAPMKELPDESSSVFEPGQADRLQVRMGSESEMMIAERLLEPEIYPVPDLSGDALSSTDRVYASEAHYSFIVDDVAAYILNIREYIQSNEGRVLTSSQGRYGRIANGYLILRVPSERFDEVTSYLLKGVDEVWSEMVNVNDETGRMMSLDEQVLQLEDKKLIKEIELLEAVSQAQRKKIELELERIERQLVTLRDQQNVVEERIDYASISITVADSVRFFDPVADLGIGSELERAWFSLRQLGVQVVYVLIWAAVYGVVLVPVVLVVRWWRARRTSDQSA